MPTTGLSLDSSLLSTLSDTAGGIANSIVNIGPEIMIPGVIVAGVLLVVNKIPRWFRAFTGR